MKPFFAIIISFRGIVSVVCVRRPFPAAFPQQVSSIFIMNSLLINCRLFKINSYNLTECWRPCVLSPQALGRGSPVLPLAWGAVRLDATLDGPKNGAEPLSLQPRRAAAASTVMPWSLAHPTRAAGRMLSAWQGAWGGTKRRVSTRDELCVGSGGCQGLKNEAAGCSRLLGGDEASQGSWKQLLQCFNSLCLVLSRGGPVGISAVVLPWLVPKSWLRSLRGSVLPWLCANRSETAAA